MNIQKNDSKVLKKKETFWTSGPLMERLAEVPEGEKSFVIRQALRQYFGITLGKQFVDNNPDQLTLEEARIVAKLITKRALPK